jgi:IS605 OrfB family transposase
MLIWPKTVNFIAMRRLGHIADGHHEWSFAELQWMIRYKAVRSGVEVVVVYRSSAHTIHIGN